MIDNHAKDDEQGNPGVLSHLRASLTSIARPPVVSSGQEAAVAIVQLMDRAANEIDPAELTAAFINAGGGHSKALTKALFNQFGVATGKVMADGTVTLAMLWESAWRVAEAEGTFSSSELGPVNKNSLRSLYEKTDFVQSLELANIEPELH
jgi:hypothetical protein